jgi:pSer/pThr/pTyr-binding forkhead associated (FHA) protein
VVSGATSIPREGRIEVVKTRLPYIRIQKEYDGVSRESLGGVLRDSLEAARERPAYLESSGTGEHCFAFLRNGQIYSAGAIRNGQFREITIKEFMLAAGSVDPQRIVRYEADSKILHSLLIIFQKKPALKLLTSLVDLDQVLDKIEEEGKSCIVAAAQDDFFAILRYEKGRVTALCHEKSEPDRMDRSLRDEFLVKIYTLSAEKPLTISVYEDLLVKYASDARVIEPGFKGNIAELFASKPPILTLEFKGREIGHWALDKPLFRIGRTPDNDIVIDNLAVSRIHAVVEEDKGKFYIRDCDSLNGTLVNQRRVGRALLREGDDIQIGKHRLVFQTRGRREIVVGPAPDGFDQTVIMRSDRRSGAPAQHTPAIPLRAAPASRLEETPAVAANRLTETPAAAAGPLEDTPAVPVDFEPSFSGGAVRPAPKPRLVERGGGDERVFEIGDAALTLGRDETADIEVGGFLVAKKHAEIAREDGHVVLRHLSGIRKVTVDGEPVRERILKNNDHIRIGKKEFVYQE